MKKLILGLMFVWIIFIINTPVYADYLRYEFNKMDGDADRYVSWKEYQTYIKYPKLQRFKRIDTDRNHKIEYNEWIYYYSRPLTIERIYPTQKNNIKKHIPTPYDHPNKYLGHPKPSDSSHRRFIIRHRYNYGYHYRGYQFKNAFRYQR